jgi:cysteine-rich repeat protein
MNNQKQFNILLALLVFALAVLVSANMSSGQFLSQFIAQNFTGTEIARMVAINLCGNGLLDFGETCDDSNTQNGDGCSSTCQLEEAFVQICTAQDLNQVHNALSGNFIQICDIDLAVTDIPGPNFVPIGTALNPFTGIYNGNGHSISHFSYNNPLVSNVGLFASVGASGRLVNVQSLECQINALSFSSCLTGELKDSAQIIDSTASGSVTGTESHIGLLAGIAIGQSQIIHSAVAGSVTSNTAGNCGTGGMVGALWHNALISRSSADVSVTGVCAGGLVGTMNDTSSVSRSRVTGTVSGQNGIGGFVSWMSGSSTVSNSSVKNIKIDAGAINTYSNAGGFVQYMSGLSAISASSAQGDWVKGTGDTIGGFAGTVVGSAVIKNSHANFATVGGTVNSSGVGGFAALLGDTARVEHSSATVNEINGKYNVGGFVGRHSDSAQITQSSVIANVNGESRVGGFFGKAVENPIIEQSYALTNVKASGEQAGGFGGYMGGDLWFTASAPKIRDSYARGSVEAKNVIGGLVGNIAPAVGGTTQAAVERSYSAVSISTLSPGPVNPAVGGFVGSNTQGNFYSNHWDIDVAGVPIPPSCGKGLCTTGISGNSTSAMQSQSTYSGWNFSTIWAIAPGGYPYLQWQ